MARFRFSSSVKVFSIPKKVNLSCIVIRHEWGKGDSKPLSYFVFISSLYTVIVYIYNSLNTKRHEKLKVGSFSEDNFVNFVNNKR